MIKPGETYNLTGPSVKKVSVTYVTSKKNKELVGSLLDIYNRARRTKENFRGLSAQEALAEIQKVMITPIGSMDLKAHYGWIESTGIIKTTEKNGIKYLLISRTLKSNRVIGFTILEKDFLNETEKGVWIYEAEGKNLELIGPLDFDVNIGIGGGGTLTLERKLEDNNNGILA